jgi:hypothetical protein
MKFQYNQILLICFSAKSREAIVKGNLINRINAIISRGGEMIAFTMYILP